MAINRWYKDSRGRTRRLQSGERLPRGAVLDSRTVSRSASRTRAEALRERAAHARSSPNRPAARQRVEDIPGLESGGLVGEAFGKNAGRAARAAGRAAVEVAAVTQPQTLAGIAAGAAIIDGATPGGPSATTIGENFIMNSVTLGPWGGAIGLARDGFD